MGVRIISTWHPLIERDDKKKIKSYDAIIRFPNK